MHNTLHRYSFKRKILKLCLQREKKNRLLCLLMFAFFCILLMEENIRILFISKLLLLGFRPKKKKSRHLIKILKPRFYFFSYNSKVQVFVSFQSKDSLLYHCPVIIWLPKKLLLWKEREDGETIAVGQLIWQGLCGGQRWSYKGPRNQRWACCSL